MLVTRTSVFTGVTRTMDLDVTQTQLDVYASGHVLLQNAFPQLSPENRDFIKYGCIPQEWDEAMGPEE